MKPLAAVVFADNQSIDAAIERAVRAAIASGANIGGILQRHSPGEPGCMSMAVENIATGRRIGIAQPLGPQAKACRLDPRALADVGAMLSGLLAEDIDVLVLNRFGKAESEGGGLRDIVATAMERGIPVLMPVFEAYREAWADFSGDLCEFVAPDATAISAWMRRVLASRLPLTA